MTRDQLIETIARGMCCARFWEGSWPPADDGVRRALLVEATAALTAIEAAGMRVVREHETDANIALRDAFIVREGLWQKFIDHLPAAAQEDSTSE